MTDNMNEVAHPLRVSIADDAALFRGGLARLLESIGVEVVDEVANGDALRVRLRNDVPDVVILDIRMPPTFTDEGLSVAERLRIDYPRLGILLLSAHVQASYAARLLELNTGSAGIGYLLKDRVSDLTTLHDALLRLRRGEPIVDPDVTRVLIAKRPRLQSLTDQERQVLQGMAEGRSNSGIADQVHLSVRTVEGHCASVFDKLGIESNARTNRRVNAVIAFLRDMQL